MARHETALALSPLFVEALAAVPGVDLALAGAVRVRRLGGARNYRLSAGVGLVGGPGAPPPALPDPGEPVDEAPIRLPPGRPWPDVLATLQRWGVLTCGALARLPAADLQARLGESFKQVADRLEQVHKGLGEMQTLAQGVGDLKHLLTNVKTRGMFVSFGNSSGPVDAFSLGLLAQKGSLYATRPTLFQYIATRPELDACANSLFDVVRSSKVRINVNQTYPLAEAGRAHTDLETRKTSGATLLIP